MMSAEICRCAGGSADGGLAGGLTADLVYRFFVDNVCRHLRIAVCLSPDDFRAAVREYPALVRDSCTDWFVTWPRRALEDIAREAYHTCTIYIRFKIYTKINSPGQKLNDIISNEGKIN